MTPYFENDSGVLYCGDMNITISNVKDNLSGVYIGRTSAFGNPYHIGKDGDRNEVIQKYRKWLYAEIKKEGKTYHAVMGLCDKLVKDNGNLNLICHCAPLPCHGEVLRSCIIWIMGGKNEQRNRSNVGTD